MARAQTDYNYNSSAVFKRRFKGGSEIHDASSPFIYSNSLNRPLANNQTLADIMTWYWISFVIYNDPNVLRAANAPFWPSYGGANITSLILLRLRIRDIFVEPDQQNSAACDFV